MNVLYRLDVQLGSGCMPMQPAHEISTEYRAKGSIELNYPETYVKLYHRSGSLLCIMVGAGTCSNHSTRQGTRRVVELDMSSGCSGLNHPELMSSSYTGLVPCPVLWFAMASHWGNLRTQATLPVMKPLVSTTATPL